MENTKVPDHPLPAACLPHSRAHVAIFPRPPVPFLPCTAAVEGLHPSHGIKKRKWTAYHFKSSNRLLLEFQSRGFYHRIQTDAEPREYIFWCEGCGLQIFLGLQRPAAGRLMNADERQTIARLSQAHQYVPPFSDTTHVCEIRILLFWRDYILRKLSLL